MRSCALASWTGLQEARDDIPQLGCRGGRHYKMDHPQYHCMIKPGIMSQQHRISTRVSRLARWLTACIHRIPGKGHSRVVLTSVEASPIDASQREKQNVNPPSRSERQKRLQRRRFLEVTDRRVPLLKKFEQAQQAFAPYIVQSMCLPGSQ